MTLDLDPAIKYYSGVFLLSMFLAILLTIASFMKFNEGTLSFFDVVLNIIVFAFPIGIANLKQNTGLIGMLKPIILVFPMGKRRETMNLDEIEKICNEATYKIANAKKDAQDLKWEEIKNAFCRVLDLYLSEKEEKSIRSCLGFSKKIEEYIEEDEKLLIRALQENRFASENYMSVSKPEQEPKPKPEPKPEPEPSP